jgi:hypothetical protein|tara:strand:- start:426 stop:653 length:228 start_codon:yes stop_codon:yes gene_type:complete
MSNKKITGGPELFEQFLGKRVKIFVKEPEGYCYKGILMGYADGFLTINDDKIGKSAFPYSNVIQLVLNEKERIEI